MEYHSSISQYYKKLHTSIYIICKNENKFLFHSTVAGDLNVPIGYIWDFITDYCWQGVQDVESAWCLPGTLRVVIQRRKIFFYKFNWYLKYIYSLSGQLFCQMFLHRTQNYMVLKLIVHVFKIYTHNVI